MTRSTDLSGTGFSALIQSPFRMQSAKGCFETGILISFLYGFPQHAEIKSRADKPGAHGQHGHWCGQAIERAASAAKNAKFEENRKGDVPVRKRQAGAH